MGARCSSCAAPLPDGAKFCGECGAPAAVRCAACGTAARRPGQRFCLECGAPLAAPTAEAPPAPPPPGSEISSVERRLVSVLFADLTGFTSFSEGRDAEDVREMLSEYFDAARRIVASYGGAVEKFIGDAVMALWGAPVAHENDAERAVRAGLDLVSAVTALGDRLGVELRLRVGVLTGEAAVELDAVAQGMVVGDAINTAARIQSVAAPGSVLVDDVTREVTTRAIAYEDGGAHAVKGKSQPVHTWRALRVVATVGGTARSELEPALVGRGDEMGRIRGAFDALTGRGASLALVMVIADAGLGKSRLVWELKKYADGLAATVLWHHGQAMSLGQGAGLSALGDMTRMRAGITVTDPPRVQRDKLKELIEAQFGPDSDAGQRAARGVSRLLGLDDGQDLITPGELFSSWRLLFERLAERAPVVMVFEDLQWADQGLVDFIAHLCEWAAQARILVLVFSRPDERLEVLTPLAERIDLQPLSSGEIEALVGSAVQDAPPALLEQVREHAAGVPLFAVESLRMLEGRGVLVRERDADRYRVVGEVDDLDVPASIHALIAARLDQLGDLERRVLRGGAVLGQRFTLSGAAALAGVADTDARALLKGLVFKQFLVVDADPRSQSRGTYAFAHKPVQRVVLGTLSKRERKARHLAAVDYLAGQSPDPDLAAILSGHLMAAFETQPTAPDAADIRTRALSLTLDAAQRADAVGALNEATALFARAAEIETDELQRASHLIRAAQSAERYGKQEAVAAAHYAAAREIHERAGRRREALRLRARELHVYQWSRAPAALIDPLREIYAALRGEPDAAFAQAAALLASVLYGDGAAQAAEPIAAEAIAAATQVHAYRELGEALNCRACALIELARPVEAVEVFEAALEMRERYAPADVPGTLGNIAITLAALGRFAEAERAGREAMLAGERAASRIHYNLAALQLARALFSLGRWDEALAMVDDVAADTEPANRGMLIGVPVLVALNRGRPARAREVLDQFDHEQAQSGAAFESDYRSLRDAALARLAQDPVQAKAVVDRAQPGDYAEWPTWLALAVDVVVRVGDEPDLAEVDAALRRDIVPDTTPVITAQIARVQALLAARAGDRAGSAASWSTAIELAASAAMPFDAAALRLERFEHLPEQPGARAEAEMARGVFAELKAGPWLDRAQEALAAAGAVPS